MSRVDSLRKEVSEPETPVKIIQEIMAKFEELVKVVESRGGLIQEMKAHFEKLADSLADISTDVNESEQINVKLAATAANRKVKLNVGGKRYTTSVDTLTREEKSFFTAMFSQRQLERDPKDHGIFIDRDSKIFAHILAYLRTGIVPDDIVTSESLRRKLIIEAEFFHLHKLTEILTESEQVSATFLDGGTLLSDAHRKCLLQFCENRHKKSELLYKASRDGFDENQFHQRCNNQGTTIIIILSNNDYLFGGYTCTPWGSNVSSITDDKAFLFTLINPPNISPTKYPLQSSNNQQAVHHNSNCGPTFVGGHALYICSNSNTTNGSYIYYIHASTGQGNNIFPGDRNFLTKDIEVFKLI